ncbi:MAG: MCP four helix bundle domain-containing protein, partial [Burkholderiales bacterium]|nr:MCP four helix bundle domain-containing protein [Burkholderiales bacterium]
MNYLNNLKIGTRLVLTLVILIAMLVLVGLQSIVKSSSVEAKMLDITERRMLIMEDMNTLRLEVNRQARSIRNMALLSNPEQIKAERNAVMESRKKGAEIRTRIDGQIKSPKAREIFARILDTGDKFRGGVDQYFKLLDGGQKEQAIDYLITDLRPVQLVYLSILNDMVEFQKQAADAASKDAVGEVTSLQMTVWVTTGAALMIAIILGIWIVRSITRPIYQAVDVARAVAAGDLSMSIQAQSRDETGLLLQALSDMQVGLVKVVGAVRQGSESVSTASAEIAQGNQDLSARTESQASALEETAASMEELS